MDNIEIELSAAEHFALTALLRHATSCAALEKMGLQGLMERLSESYRVQLKQMGFEGIGLAMALPSVTLHRTIQASELHDLEGNFLIFKDRLGRL
ncbi:hypothetical protein [Metapseudomonas otitidis]|uniref:hypothetical protein n=1 Tax=Metapseudomonas otitidis TaxID=319939 RepID=UPI0013F5CB1E|nr:hypothetical protein [Pseudomonas otitidis]